MRFNLKASLLTELLTSAITGAVKHVQDETRLLAYQEHQVGEAYGKVVDLQDELARTHAMVSYLGTALVSAETEIRGVVRAANMTIHAQGMAIRELEDEIRRLQGKAKAETAPKREDADPFGSLFSFPEMDLREPPGSTRHFTTEEAAPPVSEAIPSGPVSGPIRH